MLELLSKLTPADLAPLLCVGAAIAAGLVIGVVSIIATSLRKYHERKDATALILEMLDRGMTADEIARILTAAGFEEQSPRRRLRQKLTALLSEPAKPSPTP